MLSKSGQKYKGIFEMATGTGKTYTALGCLKNEFETTNKLFSVITCPYQHLYNNGKKKFINLD